MNNLARTICCWLVLFFIWHAYGTRAFGDDPNMQTVVKNSLGKSIRLVSLGEATYRWHEEVESGCSVVRIPASYQYAIRARDGSLLPSGLNAGEVVPKLHGIAAGLRPSAEFLREKQTGRPDGRRSPPSPHPITVVQPGGKKLSVRLKGSPAYSWYVDDDGYAIVAVDERWEYALRGKRGGLIATGLEVGTVDPSESGLLAHIRPAQAFLDSRSKNP